MSVSSIRAILHVISKEFSVYPLRRCLVAEGHRLWSKSLAFPLCVMHRHDPVLPCIDRLRQPFPTPHYWLVAASTSLNCKCFGVVDALVMCSRRFIPPSPRLTDGHD